MTTRLQLTPAEPGPLSLPPFSSVVLQHASNVHGMRPGDMKNNEVGSLPCGSDALQRHILEHHLTLQPCFYIGPASCRKRTPASRVTKAGESHTLPASSTHQHPPARGRKEERVPACLHPGRGGRGAGEGTLQSLPDPHMHTHTAIGMKQALASKKGLSDLGRRHSIVTGWQNEYIYGRRNKRSHLQSTLQLTKCCHAHKLM